MYMHVMLDADLNELLTEYQHDLIRGTRNHVFPSDAYTYIRALLKYEISKY